MNEFYIAVHPKCGKVHASILDDPMSKRKRDIKRHERDLRNDIAHWAMCGMEVKKVISQDFPDLGSCGAGSECWEVGDVNAG
jgi:hypothetical protein